MARLLATALLLATTLMLPAASQALQPEDTVSHRVCTLSTLLCVHFHGDHPTLFVLDSASSGLPVATLTWLRLTVVATGTFTQVPVTVGVATDVCSSFSSTVLTCVEVGPRSDLYPMDTITYLACLATTKMDVLVDGQVIVGNVPALTVHTGTADC